MLKRIISMIIFLFTGLVSGIPQTVLHPNIALKSHSTLDITKVVMSEKKTDIYLNIENRITGGNFCADKNIYMIYPDGTREHLISSSGIPVCPDTYNFKSVGEKLDFVLTFPYLREGVGSINLIEDCPDNCFSLYGIVLNDNLNREIDQAFSLAENDEPAKALVSFAGIAGENGNVNPGAAGLLYLNIVQLYRTTGNSVKAAEWYKKLESSGLPETAIYVKYLNSLGIRY